MRGLIVFSHLIYQTDHEQTHATVPAIANTAGTKENACAILGSSLFDRSARLAFTMGLARKILSMILLINKAAKVFESPKQAIATARPAEHINRTGLRPRVSERFPQKMTAIAVVRWPDDSCNNS